jgi:hypothetical protein
MAAAMASSSAERLHVVDDVASPRPSADRRHPMREAAAASM